MASSWPCEQADRETEKASHGATIARGTSDDCRARLDVETRRLHIAFRLGLFPGDLKTQVRELTRRQGALDAAANAGRAYLAMMAREVGVPAGVARAARLMGAAQFMSELWPEARAAVAQVREQMERRARGRAS